MIINGENHFIKFPEDGRTHTICKYGTDYTAVKVTGVL